ncbi:MAG: ATP-binding protein [Actinomycetota bacterium]
MDGLIDRLPVGVVTIGADGKVASFNARAERLVGWSRDEAIGKPWGEVLRLRDAAGRLVADHTDPFGETKPPSSGTPEREYMLTRKDGSQSSVAVRTSFDFDEQGLREVIVVIRDATPERRRELSAYDLIATLAHDLRSPLTSIKGFSATMRQRWDKLTDEQKLHMLVTMDHDSERMNRLLADLLAFTRLEARGLELRRQPIDLAELARGVGETVGRTTKTHQIKFELPDQPLRLNADLPKLDQVIQNLLENAIKHGEPGPITLSVRAEDGEAVIRVADPGPGIDPRFRPFVFSKFYHRRTQSRSTGTGLGLYICRGIVEAHGGEISIESSDRSGTVFAVHLPLDPDLT